MADMNTSIDARLAALKADRRKRAQAGFTLTELMVTILIIGLLATVVTINVLPMIGNARSTKVQTDLSNLEGAVEQFYLLMDTYPTAQEGLQALVNPPVGHPKIERFPPGGFIKRLPSDPWGNEYQYFRPGRNGAAFDIVSLGADGVPGGEAEDADLSLSILGQS